MKRLDNDDLIREKYQGIRPAPGYPACPEHTEKQVIWDLMDVEQKIGMQLTTSYAMYPGSAVSGWIFSHPESRFFAIAQIQQDQVEDYAQRKGWDLLTAERWLGLISILKPLKNMILQRKHLLPFSTYMNFILICPD